VVASLIFVAASQNWFVTRSKWYETAILLLVAFSLFRPNFWMDMITPPYQKVAATDLIQVVEKAPAGEDLRIWIEGEDINGNLVKKGMLLPLGDAGKATERLERFGLRLMPMGDQISVMSVKFRSKADKAGYRQGQIITDIEQGTNQPAPEWIYLPTLGLLALVVMAQRRRIAAGAPS
ncbi:MAG: DUF3394 domain-containing protein, partial [Thauera sp.]|nr:DUF3394 domain-containing protein [Thauera sp.]